MSSDKLGYDLRNVRSPKLLMILWIPIIIGAANLLAQSPQTAAPAASTAATETNSAPSADLDLQRKLEGRPIGRIDFDPPTQPLPREELDRLLPVHPGDPLTMDGVRAIMQQLFGTGRFADVTVRASESADSATATASGPIALTIKTELSFFVGQVSIDGLDEPPNRDQLLSAAKLELGTPFAPAAVTQAIQNMRERLRANGLYQSELKFKLIPNPATEETAIHFDLHGGPRARFGGVEINGSFNRSMDDIIRATRWRRGIGFLQFPGWRTLTENRIQTGVERVREEFQKQNRLQVRVTLDHLDYNDKTNIVVPTIVIDAGPIVEVTTVGAKVSKGRLRQLIPIYQERAVDRSLLVEGNRNLVDHFQGQGFFDVEVDYEDRTEANGMRVIEYSIARNQRHKLVAVELAGNRFFDAAAIHERLAIRQAGTFRNRYGRYSQRLRDRDRDAIRGLYLNNGFRDVVVSATTIDDYHGRTDELAVRFEIEEGRQWFVRNLEFEGISDTDATYLRGILQSTVGQAYSQSSIANDRDTVLNFYFNNGYPDAAFDWTEAPGEANRVSLVYQVKPGERQYVRDVLVRGLSITNPDLVASRLRIKPGSAVSQSQIAESQQRLYDLGIFSKVQTALQNPDGDEDSKYVIFQLDEAARYALNAGFGAELARIGGGVTTFDSPAGEAGFSPRISLGITRLNLLGRGHTIGVQGRASTLQQRGVISYQAAQFTGNENLTLTISGLFDTSRDVRTFAARRWETAIALSQRLSRANTLNYRFSFRRVTVDENTVKISPQLIPLLSQPVRVGQLSVSFIQDRRDNPTDSHRGVYNTVDLGLSVPQFGSMTDFARLVLRNSTYHQIGKDVVLARTLQFGYTQRTGGLAEIPFAERFFSGGAASHRAFPDNQAGPRDLTTGFPLGGNALLFHQTELRFPLFGDNVGGVLFHDMGNVYSDLKNVSFHFRQRDIEDFDYLVHAVGFGIRYKTPVGPIRVDFSFSPNSPKFFGFQGTRDQLLQGLGTLTNQRINVFQFHFSLGQTF